LGAGAKRAGVGKMYKYDEKSRQGKAGFGYYISAERARCVAATEARTHAHKRRQEKKEKY